MMLHLLGRASMACGLTEHARFCTLSYLINTMLKWSKDHQSGTSSIYQKELSTSELSLIFHWKGINIVLLRLTWHVIILIDLHLLKNCTVFSIFFFFHSGVLAPRKKYIWGRSYYPTWEKRMIRWIKTCCLTFNSTFLFIVLISCLRDKFENYCHRLPCL